MAQHFDLKLSRREVSASIKLLDRSIDRSIDHFPRKRAFLFLAPHASANGDAILTDAKYPPSVSYVSSSSTVHASRAFRDLAARWRLG